VRSVASRQQDVELALLLRRAISPLFQEHHDVTERGLAVAAAAARLEFDVDAHAAHALVVAQDGLDGGVDIEPLAADGVVQAHGGWVGVGHLRGVRNEGAHQVARVAQQPTLTPVVHEFHAGRWLAHARRSLGTVAAPDPLGEIRRRA
jgi:hypothetical protein